MIYHDRFDEILAEMSRLHNKKGADYGSGTDPYANVRASQEFGIAPWIGALVRLNDKITRLKAFIRNGNLVNESVEDSIRDIQVYAVIMGLLYDETAEQTDMVEMQKIDPSLITRIMETESQPYCYCPDTRFGDHPGHPVHLKGYKPYETERDKKGGLPLRWYVVMPQEPGHAEVQRWLDIIE